MGIDFDNIAERLDEALLCLNSLPQPYSIRLSSGKKGLHIVLSCDDKKYRERWDDPKRLMIDKIRAKHGLTGDILADVKCIGKDRRVSGKWKKIENGLKFKNNEELKKFIMEELK
jgi:hypothetical protein